MLPQRLSQLRRIGARWTSSFYVSTPIFYVNAAPHIGHLYSAVIADTICRYEALQRTAAAVHLCTGTDEHGAKIQQAAVQHNVPVAKYCEEISACYRDVFQQALINYTDFIRTTEDRHKRAVSHFWRELNARGFIYSSQYSGWYCLSDETFLTDTQLRLDNASGIRYSMESGHSAEWTEEKNYMFRLSAVQDDVLHWLQKGDRVRPKKFEKILLDTLSESLPDVSISRPIGRVHWAIPVPDDATQSVYVWLDALINYLTSAGYPDASYRNLWPPNVQVIGKDILKFHGVFWPGFLIAAGLEPPRQLFVHSHWTVDGQKMSKSKYNVISPTEAAQTYTMEGLRYFLLREGVAHSDGNYSSVKAQRILNAELADTLGNLLSRACAKSLNPQQIYPHLHALHLHDILQMDAAKRLADALQQLQERCGEHYGERNFHLVVDNVISALHAANNFFETLRPWELKAIAGGSVDNGKQDDKAISSATRGSTNAAANRLPTTATTTTLAATATTATTTRTRTNVQQRNIIEDASRLETIIAMTMDALRLCGIVLQPIVPQLSGKLLDKLAVPQQQRLWRNLSENFANEHFIKSGATISGAQSGGGGGSGGADGRQQGRPLGAASAVLFRRILPAAAESNEQLTATAAAAATATAAAHNKSNKKQSTQQKSRKQAS